MVFTHLCYPDTTVTKLDQQTFGWMLKEKWVAQVENCGWIVVVAPHISDINSDRGAFSTIIRCILDIWLMKALRFQLLNDYSQKSRMWSYSLLFRPIQHYSDSKINQDTNTPVMKYWQNQRQDTSPGTLQTLTTWVQSPKARLRQLSGSTVL